MSDARRVGWIGSFLALFGLLVLFLTPPIQSADEDSHFIRAVMVSRLDLSLHREGEVVGQQVPKSLVNYVESHRSLVSDPDMRYSYARWYQESFAAAQTDTSILHRYSGQSLSPLYYMPQVIGVWVGRAVYALTPADVPFSWSSQLYFARLGNLVFYVSCFLWAIKTALRFRHLLAFLAVTPMALSLAASASYDVFVVCTAVCFLAKCVQLWDQPRWGWRDLAVLALLSFFLGHNKVVYAPLLLVLLAAAPSLGWRQIVPISMACGGLALAGAAVSSVLFGLPANPALEQAVDAQAAYVLANLPQMPGLILTSIVDQRQYLFTSTLGSLGWLNANFPAAVLVLWGAIGVFAATADGLGSAPLQRAVLTGVLMLAAAAISAALLFVAMYISWTSVTTGVGVPKIDSVQGRYLLPILPFFLGGGALVLGKLSGGIGSLGVPTLTIQCDEVLRVASTVMASLMVFMLVVRYWV